MKHSTLLLVFAAAACTRTRIQEVTPVRVDTTHIVAPVPAPTTSSRPATVADDPLARIDRMDWPGPNAYRDASGRPGPAYWQQRADYDIQATLDTGTKTLTGQVTIHYTNNSPDTLHFVWLQLDQNLYRPGSKGSALFPADSRWGVRGFEGGYRIAAVTVDGKPDSIRVDDTMGRIGLPSPLAPKGGTTTIVVRYSFPIPEHGSDRMGRDGTLYEMAQWYPRMAVYDDVRGWNPDPYLGQGEFYLEYGNITYAVTVPAGYTVAGSGVLDNASEVLSSAERQRLARAQRSDSVIAIIGADEARATPSSGTKTWRFHADDVRDVAWTAAPDFRWDATSWNGILCQAFYQRPKAGKAWESAAEQTCWTIRYFSQMFFPYPYPQATSVAGTVSGMEYPMLVMVGYGTDDPRSIFGVDNHELGHQWFPMIVGSNERRYAWMDEGINTYIDAFGIEARYAGRPEGDSVWAQYLGNWRRVADAHTQSPLMTRPDHIAASALGAIGYRKPGAVLLTLRDVVVGPEAFDRAFREYIRRWAFRHPTPADFFRTIENSTGEDLSWFWRAFFYGTDVLDIGIDQVRTTQRSGQQVAEITLHRATSIPFPVTMRLRLADGSTTDVRLPVDIWSQGDRFTAIVPVGQRVVGARLWPGQPVPDWNPSNDVWGDAPAAVPVGRVTGGGLGPQVVTR